MRETPRVGRGSILPFTLGVVFAQGAATAALDRGLHDATISDAYTRYVMLY